MTREELGKIGEDLALEHLLEKGFTLLHRNWRFNKLEIDLVMTHQSVLVIVEVKTRETAKFGDPWGFVTVHQQRHLISAADAYAKYHRLDLDVRFDVVGLIHNSHRTEIQHLPDAFFPLA